MKLRMPEYSEAVKKLASTTPFTCECIMRIYDSLPMLHPRAPGIIEQTEEDKMEHVKEIILEAARLGIDPNHVLRRKRMNMYNTEHIRESIGLETKKETTRNKEEIINILAYVLEHVDKSNMRADLKPILYKIGNSLIGLVSESDETKEVWIKVIAFCEKVGGMPFVDEAVAYRRSLR